MVFVTGGTGLIGSHLLYELAGQNRRIVALKRANSNTGRVKSLFQAYSSEGALLFDKITWVDGEVEDYKSLLQAMRNAEEVYHCAAVVSFNRKDFSKMIDINVHGTANVVDACLEMGIKRLCHVSSVAAIGSPAGDGMVTESVPWGKSKGKSGYSVSKFRSEMEVWRGMDLGLNVVVVNPTVVIGPGQWNSGSGQIFGTISKGFPFYTTGITGYVDVRDVAKAMVVATEKEMWGKKYILNGENISHKEVFETIAQELGKNPPTIYVRPWMGALGWRFAWLGSKLSGKAPTITRDTVRSGYSITKYSAELAQNDLGITFTSVADAIANTASVGEL